MGNTATSKEEENVEEQEKEEETTTAEPTDDASTNGKKRPLDETNNDDNGGDSGMNDKSLEKKQKHTSAGDSAEAAASKVVEGTGGAVPEAGGEDGTSNVDQTEQASKTATESTPTTAATTTDEPAKPTEAATGATKPGVEDDVTMIPPGTVGIDVYNDFDVLSGRGGGTNVHGGNRDFRDMINKNRTRYLRAKKNDKPAISRSIVKEIRSRGGRFLKLNNKDKLYYEIGDDQAREKTSQCLRQKAPEIRKLMFEASQQQATDVTAVGATTTTTTTTGAAAGTGMNGTPGAHVNTGVSVGATNPAALPPGVASVLGQPSVMPMGLPFGVMAQAQYQQQLLAMQSMNQQACMMHPAMMMANGGGGGGVVAMTNPMLLQTMMANSAVPGLPPVRGGMAPGPMMYNNMPQGVANVGHQTTLSNVTPGGPGPGPGPANQPNGPGQKKQNAEL
mmetsp:Transcript_42964/g.103865  ORF Transcript_42964/g.103865 Transcript_42964/m.103865 type:complete len:448 (-) Transcript_42964:222-1565(-)